MIHSINILICIKHRLWFDNGRNCRLYRTQSPFKFTKKPKATRLSRKYVDSYVPITIKTFIRSNEMLCSCRKWCRHWWSLLMLATMVCVRCVRLKLLLLFATQCHERYNHKNYLFFSSFSDFLSQRFKHWLPLKLIDWLLINKLFWNLQVSLVNIFIFFLSKCLNLKLYFF